MPEISVVIPTCDRPLWLQRALRSVRAQVHAADEIIVVDNGTTALPPETLPDDVILLRLAPRVGVSAARNAGAARAKGDYIAFLDDDDEWAADYLGQMIRAINLSAASPDLLVGRKCFMVEGEQVAEHCLKQTDGLLQALLVGNPGITGQNIVIRREAFIEAGGFDETLAVSEDRALAIELLLQNKRLAIVPEATAILHRGRGDHLSKSPAMLAGSRMFLRKYRPLMNLQARRLNHARILTLCATQNRERNWLLSKAQRLTARLLKRMAQSGQAGAIALGESGADAMCKAAAEETLQARRAQSL